MLIHLVKIRPNPKESIKRGVRERAFIMVFCSQISRRGSIALQKAGIVERGAST